MSGVDSHPIGPSDLGVFRIAAPFTPTASGQAQLLSMRGRCVVPWPKGSVCANVGKVTLHADAGGKPADQAIATMGFYLLEGSEGSWELRMHGNPTGGSFRVAVTVGGVQHTTAPLRFDAWHGGRHGCDDLATIAEILDCFRNPQAFRPNVVDALADAGVDAYALSDGGRFPDDPAYLRLNGTVAVTDVQLTGGRGRDTLFGGRGHDVLRGGPGRDRLVP